MARRSPVNVGLALALIFVITSNGQANDACRTGCKGASQTFKHQEGTTYKYNYDSKIEVTLSSAEGQKSITEVKATVLLTQQSDCNQVVRLQNVQIIGSDGKKHGQVPDVDKPIRINYHDGHLEDSICVTPGDSQNSLNLKRAVASLFQVNLKNGHETDVFGLCPTEVSQHKEGNVLVVQKSRNLNRCAFRESIQQDFLATAFNLNSEIKSSPILNGDYSAKLRIKNGILDQATVNEEYLYVPFSVGNNGARASVETTLKLAGTSKDNTQAKVSQPKSIIFENPHPVNSPKANVNSILAAVKETAKTIDVTIGEKTAKEFANLVRILRVSKKDDLLAVYNQIRAGVGFGDKAAAKKLFLDALLRAANGDNIEVAIELLKNRELNELEQKLVYFGLSMVRHPTPGSLEAVVNLLNQPTLPRSAYLGIGTLAGRYCRQHSCKNEDSVNKLTQKLVQKLGNGKASNKQEENNIVYALKALGNIHHLNDAILAKITAIAQDKKAPNRLRATALETYLADPCKDKLRDSALNILKDIQQDSEIRIKAYLAAAQCPNNKVGNVVKTLLQNEPSYQVGGFIVSHIRNVRASTNPDKELAKQYLGQITLPNRFPFDLRKYSANGEFSYTIDTLGVANSIESNVIYSQKSFLPRSTSLNLTAEVFGHTFNFLEVETRQENLDRLIEHYLGPRGLLRSNSLQDLWESKGEHAKNIVNNLKEKLQKTLRARRDVSKSEIDHIAKQVQIKTNELNNDLDVDLSVKAFGSEVLFFNVNDDVAKYTPEAIIDKFINDLNQGIDRLKNFEETLRSNLLFLDAEFAYPTSSGFPLRLGVEGSSNVQVKAAGSIDLRTLAREDGTVKISLIPSANIEVAGRLTVDALVLESGLKVVSNLHTATGGDLVVNLFNSGVDVKFSLPVEKQDLVSASHDILFYTREWGGPEIDTPLKFAQNKPFSICMDQLSPFIGLAFCAEVAAPNLDGEKVPILPFPLSGDAKFSVTIEREDLSLYHYKSQAYSTSNKLGGEIILEALNKGGQQKVSLALEGFLLPEKYARATLRSPGTSISLEGRITDTDNEKSISLQLLQDQNEYSGKLGVGIQGSPQRSVFKPILQYKTPQNSGLQVPPYRLEGQVIVERAGPDKTTYTFDNVRMIIPNQKTISVNGKIGTESQTIFADVTLSDGSQSGSFKGKLGVNPGTIKYNAEVKNSINPIVNVHIKGELDHSPEELKHFFQLAHGGDFSDKNNILTIENVWVRKSKGPEDYHLDIKNKLTYPAIPVNLKFDLELKPRAIEYEVVAQYESFRLGSELDFEYTKKQDGAIDYDLEFGAEGLNNALKLKAKRQVTGDLSQIENFLEFGGKRIEVNGKVRHRVKPHDLDIGSDLIVKIPTHNAPFHVVNGLKITASDFDLTHKVSSANVVYVDLFLKANKGGNANGSIKINLKGQLVANGQIKSSRGNGNGEIVIELPSAGRSAKFDTTFTIHEPRYNLVINIYPLFNQDKTKKITLSTQNTINPNNIDSKNLVEVFGEKLEANIKGNQQGDVTNGKINGEVEVILPTNHYLAGKLHREMTTVNNVVNGNFLVNLEHRRNKNQPGDRVSLKGTVKNTNVNEGVYDVDYQLQAESASGQNINADLGVKRSHAGPNRNIEITNKIYGSVLQSPLETTVKASYQNYNQHNVEVRSTYAPLGNGLVTVKFDSGEGKPCSGEVNVEVNSHGQALRSLKVGLSGFVLKGDTVEVKGQGKVYADSPKGPIVDLEGRGEVRVSDKEGRVKGSGRVNQAWNGAVDAGFSVNEAKDNQQIKGDVSLQYGQNQHIKGDIVLTRLPQHEYKLDVKLDTPSEKFRSSRLQVHTKRNEDGSRQHSEVIATSNGRSWTTTTDLVLSNIAPSVDIKVKDPEGKLQQLLVKVTKSGGNQFAGQLKVVSQKDNFLLESSVDANVESVDNFHIKVTANSPSLKIDKVQVEAQNKPAKTGRRIQVTAKSGNKNILAGSTSYNTREERGKLIVEGSGSFKVKDETKSANFKYIRENLIQSKNGETGIDISFDASLGNKAVDAELRVTNKHFRILNSYCEEKKQCAHVEIDVKTNVDNPAEFNQVIEVSIDLRKLGLSHEFGLKAVTHRKEYILDHTVDVHFQSQESSKYQYSLYLHPKEAGVSLTTPKRIIALESKVEFPQNLEQGGRISGEAVLYMDKKNQPNQKSGVQAYLNIVKTGKVGVDGEIKFTNPALRRPLLASIKTHTEVTDQKITANTVVVLDVFAQPDQKVVITHSNQYPGVKYDSSTPYEVIEVVEVKSSGLRLDIRSDERVYLSSQQKLYKYSNTLKYHVGNARYDNELSYELTSNSVRILATLLNHPIFRLNSQFQLSKEQQIVNTEIQCYGHKPLVSHLEVKNYNTLKYSIGRKDTPNDKLTVNAGFIPGQIADFRADVIKGGQTHQLGHATLKLDDANFLKSDYNVQSKNIEEYLLKPLKNGIDGETQELQRLSDEALKGSQQELQHLGEISSKAVPDLGPIRQYYVGELDKIKQEILEDKTIKDMSEFFYNIIGAVVQAFSEVFSSVSAAAENIAKSLQESFGKIIEAVQKDLLPKIKEISDKVLQVVGNVINTATEMVLIIGTKLAEIAEKFRPELEQLFTIFTDISQDVFRAGIEVYEAIRNVIGDQIHQVYKEIQNLPAYEQLKTEFQSLLQNGVIDPTIVANTFKDVMATLKDLAPNEEFKAFIEAITDYIVAKLTSDKPVDDKVYIDRIIKTATTAGAKVSEILTGGDVTPDLQNVKLPLPVNIFDKLPRWGATKFSPLSYLLREDVVVPSEFLTSLVNKPRNWVPPFPLYGLIAQGQHIFTFDGKHLTFPGKCNYLLARDAVDGNFTLIGTYNNGLLVAISLTQGADTITLKKNGQVTLNNAPAEFPVRKPNVAAFRDTERIHLTSNYGVHVICGPELLVCSVTASGFYHGKIRGLLGDGNNEPYDDFTIPNGKIVSSESEFGNAYKTTSNCAAVQTVSHQAHHPVPACTKLFGTESTWRYCYPFVNPNNFKTACEHGVAAKVKDTEHAIAVAYVAACNQHGIPVRVPSEFVKCTNGDKPTVPGDKFSVKTPGKQADIVLLVDTNKNNEQVYKEYVQPLVQQLTSELHSKGISDVEFHTIAFGGENQWPSHITVSGGKLTFKGKAPNLKFSETPAEEPLAIGCPQVDNLVNLLNSIGYDLKLALGQDLQARTWTEGVHYPFRANAIKSIVVVTGKPCEVGRFFPLQLLRTLLYRDKTINLNVITSIDKPKSDAKNIVGFNSRNVFSLPGGKSKVKHFADLDKELTYNDYCIDFTVQNDGNVFIADHFLQVPKGQRKQFVQVTSHNIVDQLIGVEKGYDCECRYVTPYTAQNVCHLVMAKERPQKKAGAKS